tara:strand:- start:841 stop:1074 length:234 start_codon:yes stop_codon:yes gene_type:complete
MKYQTKFSSINLAMELSDGLFAWHLIGVLTAISESTGSYIPRLCPNPEEVALEYLQSNFPINLKKAESACKIVSNGV